MSDPAIQNARQRREILTVEINTFQQQLELRRKELARVEQFIADWNQFAGVRDEDERQPLKPVTIKHPVNPPRDLVGNAVAHLLERAKRPLPRDELFQLLADVGVNIYGKNPAMVLSTMMWRMQDRFVRIPAHGYWFADRAWPPAKYDPAKERHRRTIIEDHEIQEVDDLLGPAHK